MRPPGRGGKTNSPSTYYGQNPPCDTCISRNNCKTGMVCTNFISWTSQGDKAVGERIPMKRLMERL